MKAILLVVCAALVAYLVLFRQSADQAPVEAPTAASTSLSQVTPASPGPADGGQAASPLAQQIASFAQTADSLPQTQRKATAERLIDELKTSVVNGADLQTAYAQAKQLTPNIESEPKPLEALNYKIWMAMKDQYTPPAPPTAAQQQQLDAYREASDKAIDEVLRNVEGEDARRAAIEERLSALRLEIFGNNVPQALNH